MKIKSILLFLSILFLAHAPTASALNTQERMDSDIAAGKAIVIQASVALADNVNQGIIPVPSSIGNGQDARTNLYWGARYGLKTYMVRDGGWEKVASLKTDDKRILERLVLKKSFLRKGHEVQVYLIADAWDGKYIRDTILQFLNYNAGKDIIDIKVGAKKIQAGAGAHLIAYVGHNGLMDYSNVSNPKPVPGKQVNDAVVLACISKDYFQTRLKNLGAHPLVFTTGLMAPEAYSLDAAIKAWISGEDDIGVRKAAARSYNKYQRTGLKAAERLFGVK